MKFSLINYMEHCLLSVSGQCGGKSAVSLAFVSFMCLEQRFHGGPIASFRLWFALFSHPPLPFYQPWGCTVNSPYSDYCRDLQLMSSLARVCNGGSLYHLNICHLIFAWDLAAIRIIGVSVIAGCPQCES